MCLINDLTIHTLILIIYIISYTIYIYIYYTLMYYKFIYNVILVILHVILYNIQTIDILTHICIGYCHSVLGHEFHILFIYILYINIFSYRIVS